MTGQQVHRNPRTPPYLSIIIPAFNEEDRILSTLDRIRPFLNDRDYSSDVIVVDDGSTDRTTDVVEAHRPFWPALSLVRHARNRGKGSSVRTGFEHAKGEILLFTDADLSTPIEETDKLLDAIKLGADVAIGSRAMKESAIRVHQPWYRETMGKIFNQIVRLVALPEIGDTQCGFKAFTRKAAEVIIRRQSIEGFAFDVEMLFIAKRLGFGIREVPISWINHPKSHVHVIIDSLRMLRDVIRIPWIHRKNKF
jgi:dolichyl-phosphate beta-glucosyltransferase